MNEVLKNWGHWNHYIDVLPNDFWQHMIKTKLHSEHISSILQLWLHLHCLCTLPLVGFLIDLEFGTVTRLINRIILCSIDKILMAIFFNQGATERLFVLPWGSLVSPASTLKTTGPSLDAQQPWACRGTEQGPQHSSGLPCRSPTSFAGEPHHKIKIELG